MRVFLISGRFYGHVSGLWGVGEGLSSVLAFSSKGLLLLWLGLTTAAGLLVYAFIVYWFKLEETDVVLRMLRSRWSSH